MDSGTEPISKICRFYSKECCVPYAFSFYLTLVIYAGEFYVFKAGFPFSSIAAYLILALYYFYNLKIYIAGSMHKIDPVFFISFLTLKIFIWGALLIALCAL